MRLRSSFLLLLCAALIVHPHPTEAQSTSQHVPFASEVKRMATIAALDSAMFCAFNAHDADRLGTWFTPDLEFYHDKSGLAGYDTTMANFRGLFARNAGTSRFYERYLNNPDEVKDPKDHRTELNWVIG